MTVPLKDPKTEEAERLKKEKEGQWTCPLCGSLRQALVILTNRT
jgi:hypothetical protein